VPANVSSIGTDGVICAAPVLDGWFRAQTVQTFDETDEVLVKFVDYGGYLRIAAADLRQIRFIADNIVNNYQT